MAKKSTSLVLGKKKISIRRRRAVQAGEQASAHIDKLIIRRWTSVNAVKRHVTVWLLVLLAISTGLFVQNRQLAGYYREPSYAAGGSYTEGIVGGLTNMNPIFATGPVDSSASRLLFSGLLKYDLNNRLVGDLAESITPDDRGVTYTVKLRPGLTWHDGKPVTSRDVLFTFQTIQHPDTRSPLNGSWQLIKIDAPDESTIIFTLPVALTSFPQSLTTGIIPQHILASVPPSQLRSHPFNTKEAIGTGPFKLTNVVTLSLDSKEINFEPFDDYWNGTPKLDRVSFRTYADQDALSEGFRLGDVQAIGGVSDSDKLTLGRAAVKQYNLPQANGVFAFFRSSTQPLDDHRLREALVMSVDTNSILQDTLKNSRLPLNGPLLRSQLPYGPDLQQLDTNPDRAAALLDEAGWTKQVDGTRTKDGKPLELTLVTQNTPEYSLVASALQKQWLAQGIKLKVELVSEQELQQNHIVPHNYDILLYGISLGSDPDVYAYWHSREAGLGGFNLSEYRSPAADASLEAGRTRSDATLRSIKYKGFLQAWRADIPALALYQPSFEYIQSADVNGFVPRVLVTPSDRFENIQNWMVEQRIRDKQYP